MAAVAALPDSSGVVLAARKIPFIVSAKLDANDSSTRPPVQLSDFVPDAQNNISGNAMSRFARLADAINVYTRAENDVAAIQETQVTQAQVNWMLGDSASETEIQRKISALEAAAPEVADATKQFYAAIKGEEEQRQDRFLIDIHRYIDSEEARIRGSLLL